MTVTLTDIESEQFFRSALCNGLSQLQGYGIQLEYDNGHYMKAKEALKMKIICREDVWLEILRQGNPLKFYDEEEDDDVIIRLADVHEKVAKTPFEHLSAMITGDDDAYTADAILQTVIYGEIIYG